MASKGKTYVWWVEHPEHTVAVVVADSWEQATVEAATWWEVPWAKVAAMCSEKKEKEPIKRGVCCECGGLLWSPGSVKARCSKCESIAKQKEETQRARNRRFFSEMHQK